MSSSRNYSVASSFCRACRKYAVKFSYRYHATATARKIEDYNQVAI